MTRLLPSNSIIRWNRLSNKMISILIWNSENFSTTLRLTLLPLNHCYKTLNQNTRIKLFLSPSEEKLCGHKQSEKKLVQKDGKCVQFSEKRQWNESKAFRLCCPTERIETSPPSMNLRSLSDQTRSRVCAFFCQWKFRRCNSIVRYRQLWSVSLKPDVLVSKPSFIMRANGLHTNFSPLLPIRLSLSPTLPVGCREKDNELHVVKTNVKLAVKFNIVCGTHTVDTTNLSKRVKTNTLVNSNGKNGDQNVDIPNRDAWL